MREKMGKMLELPLDMIKDYSRITVMGNESILIENYKGIIEYEEQMIHLSNGIMIVGKGLNIDEITDDEIIITGDILKIEFE